MDPEIREKYWLGITIIEARDMLVAMNISDYPHMKKEGRTMLHRQMHAMAYPQSDSIAYTPEVKLEEFSERLGRLING